MAPSFEIPLEYRDRLEPVEPKDLRPDDEILESLTRYVPVTSEQNVWSFWSTGVKAMPGWQRRNVIAWVRMCSADGWTVRVIDNEPTSPNYALNFVAAESLPETFVKRTHSGQYVGQHSADFVRGALLYDHGGVYLDVGTFVLRDFARIGWDKLIDPESPYTIALPLMGKSIINFFIAARKGDPFIKRWHELFCHLWENRTDHIGLMDHPLMDTLMKYAQAAMDESGVGFTFACGAKGLYEYLGQVAAFQRVAILEDIGDGFSGVDYWMNRVLLFDIHKEFWPTEQACKFNPALAFELLSMKRDQDVGSEKHKQAESMVWDALANASAQKISRGKNITTEVMLGEFLDLPENKGVDGEPGSFFELLRLGPLHMRQKRTDVATVPSPKPDNTMKKGLLEH